MVLDFPLPGPNHLQNLTPKCKILNVLWTSAVATGRQGALPPLTATCAPLFWFTQTTLFETSRQDDRQ